MAFSDAVWCTTMWSGALFSTVASTLGGRASHSARGWGEMCVRGHERSLQMLIGLKGDT
ncbi:hypothetical protein GCM10010402_15520 [Actinomadura luteofluorescens]